MKKMILISAIALICITSKAQTTITKQEVDTAVISKIYDYYSIDPIDGRVVVAKKFKEKKEFVNDMILAFIKRKAKDCAGNKASDDARKQAEDEINTKVIIKVE